MRVNAFREEAGIAEYVPVRRVEQKLNCDLICGFVGVRIAVKVQAPEALLVREDHTITESVFRVKPVAKRDMRQLMSNHGRQPPRRAARR